MREGNSMRDALLMRIWKVKVKCFYLNGFQLKWIGLTLFDTISNLFYISKLETARKTRPGIKIVTKLKYQMDMSV
jgi:hypothetical protein